MSALVDKVNQATMVSAATVAFYGSHDGLQPAELAACEAAAAAIAAGPVLDLGVGGGRTTSYFLARNTDYRGIDYSPAMVARCRQRFPGVRFEQGDARDLHMVADASCGFVLFSCNGIGMVDFPGRQRILKEIARVLRPGGFFAFSFHDQDHAPKPGSFQWPGFEPSLNPLRVAVRAARFARNAVESAVNRRRNLPLEDRTSEYALVNDPCRNYGTMLCYVTFPNQRRHLAEAGFRGTPRAWALDGHELAPNETCADGSLMLLVER